MNFFESLEKFYLILRIKKFFTFQKCAIDGAENVKFINVNISNGCTYHSFKTSAIDVRYLQLREKQIQRLNFSSNIDYIIQFY